MNAVPCHLLSNGYFSATEKILVWELAGCGRGWIPFELLLKKMPGSGSVAKRQLWSMVAGSQESLLG